MRRKELTILAILALSLTLVLTAQAQPSSSSQEKDQKATSKMQEEHSPYTRAGVTRVYHIKAHPGSMEWFMKDLDKNFKPIWDEEKAQGIITGYSIHLNTNHAVEDSWDVAIVISFKNWAAFDEEQAGEAIALKHYGSKEAMQKSWEERFKHVKLVESLTLQDVTLN